MYDYVEETEIDTGHGHAHGHGRSSTTASIDTLRDYIVLLRSDQNSYGTPQDPLRLLSYDNKSTLPMLYQPRVIVGNVPLQCHQIPSVEYHTCHSCHGMPPSRLGSLGRTMNSKHNAPSTKP